MSNNNRPTEKDQDQSVKGIIALIVATLFGGALVVGSGIYIARREYVATRAEGRRLRRTMYPPDA